MFLVDPVFFPFELLERSRNSRDFGFNPEVRFGFFEGLVVEVFCVPRSVFRVPCSVFRVSVPSFLFPDSSFLPLTSCSLPLVSVLLPLLMDASSVEDELEMAALISFIS